MVQWILWDLLLFRERPENGTLSGFTVIPPNEPAYASFPEREDTLKQ